MADFYSIAGPLLRFLDAETAHNMTIAALKGGFNPFTAPAGEPNLPVELFGLTFPNPVGIAAGFDKNADVPDAMLAMGFGFAEVGTVTPLPQDGNPQPRLFRLEQDRAVINRMGFNNEGHAAVKAKLAARAGRGGIVGVNIGANKSSNDRIADYTKGLEVLHEFASYMTINVSSPNTPGLRGLQSRGELEDLIGRLHETRSHLASEVPLLLKIAPDLGEDEMDDIAAVCLDTGVDGLIISNTTISRPALRSKGADEQGGLSGDPLYELSTIVLAKIHQRTGGRLPLVGVGGIASGDSAWEKIRAGASLIQLYSSLIFEGPGLIIRIRRNLARKLAQHGYASVTAAAGCGAQDWAKKDVA